MHRLTPLLAAAAVCVASVSFAGRADAGALGGAPLLGAALDGIQLIEKTAAGCLPGYCARRVYAPVKGPRVVRGAHGELTWWTPGVGAGRVPRICVENTPYGPTQRWVMAKGTGFGWGW